MRCPCRGCTNREVGCHSSCSQYDKWRKNLDEKKRYEAKQVDRTLDTLRIQKNIRNLRKYGKG